MVVVSVRLPDELIELIKTMADSEKRSVSGQTYYILDDWFKMRAAENMTETKTEVEDMLADAFQPKG